MQKEWRTIVTQGFYAGLIGYVIVAAVIAIFDLVAGYPLFRTPAMFGEAMFYGLRDPGQLRIEPGPVFAFNGVHLITFQLLGLAAAWLAWLSERGPQFWYIGAVVFLFVLFHMFGAVLLVSNEIRAAVAAWQLAAAGFAAFLAMAVYLIGSRPKLRFELTHYRDE
jgi:hypothetical protein